jgi:hypothetical protein
MALSIICDDTTVAFGMMAKSAWISHSSPTADTTRIPHDRAKSPRGLCHVHANAKEAAPANAPIHVGMTGRFPPTILPTNAMLIKTNIMLKSGSRGERGEYLQGLRAGGKGRNPRLLPTPMAAGIYLQVGYVLRMRRLRCNTSSKLRPMARTNSPSGVRNHVLTQNTMAVVIIQA